MQNVRVNIEFEQDASVGVCDSCGTKQTLPKVNDEVVANLFNRAIKLRLKAEFDKAAEIYEKIIDEDNANAEAHWGLVLCKYGIEYVEDPATKNRIPTCHRVQYQSVLTDVDYLAALENADSMQQSLYTAQALEISKVQKGILDIVKTEKPFDVFICYKETDENGKRTADSVLANDVYYQLTREGLKVFYAAITLEDKLGQEYEPYIFAALNSAKVMLVMGTKPEYFEAVWVRNEWARFLMLLNADRSRLLIPCYRDMDPYDLPEEFSHLQAQDMAKIGFINDLVRGIKKVVNAGKPQKETEKETVIVNQTVPSNVAPLLERAFMFLEDGKWADADAYCEKVLDLEPKNARAYLGKLMAQLHIKKESDLKNAAEPFDRNDNAVKAAHFDPVLVEKFKADNAFIRERNEIARKEAIYQKAQKTAANARTAGDLDSASKLFLTIRDYKDAETQAKAAESKRKNALYEDAVKRMASDSTDSINSALEIFKSIPDWRDSRIKIKECGQKIEALNREAERAAAQLKEAAQKKKRRKRVMIALVIALVLASLAIVAFTLFTGVKNPYLVIPALVILALVAIIVVLFLAKVILSIFNIQSRIVFGFLAICFVVQVVCAFLFFATAILK